MLVEKLRSLLKLGPISTRYKDIFDIFYLSQHIDSAKLKLCMDAYIFNDTEMHENSVSDIINRIQRTFSYEPYLKSLIRSNNEYSGQKKPLVRNGGNCNTDFKETILIVLILCSIQNVGNARDS